MVKLSQNFLVDRNLLDVIDRLAALSADDVVLEIGGGLGILSTRLATRCGYLHVVEIDRQLEPALREKLAPFENVSLHIADALELNLNALSPPPSKVVANLPYAIAASAVLRTIEELSGVSDWVVMVQREVGERLAAAPGGASYGIPSVLAQLATDVKLLRRVPRSVFRPVPNVDSVLIGLRRRGAAASPKVRRLVQAAFAHRRKTLAGSLALAGASREEVQAAVAKLGHPADVRAERLAPAEFRQLSELLGE
jgi:16S rRNA (adenine1518-N6/adenine1519-N6)-dimethyltransferase